jgi:hypothetical protein
MRRHRDNLHADSFANQSRASVSAAARFGEKMFFTCIELTLQTMLLGFEAQSVIGLRLRKLADGGPAALTETHRMMTEKTAALAEAAATFGAGGTVSNVVRRLRTHVQANEARLLGSLSL